MANMVDSDDENEAPMSIKDRMRLFERSNTDPASTSKHVDPSRKMVPPLTRSFTTPDRESSVRRPQLSQLTSTSEEIIQKTKSGLLDLTEKGKATFHQAGRDLNGLRVRVANQRKGGVGWDASSTLSSPVSRREDGDLIEFSSDDDQDGVSDADESPVSRSNSSPNTERVEPDRKEDDKIETQLSEHFANFKMMSQSAISTVSNATISPLLEGARNSFGAASKNTSELWQASGAKIITDKMSEDLRDYANHRKGSMGLCSKCEKFPREKDHRGKNGAPDFEMTFETPLERILYHSDWCRLCGFFLRNLCLPDNDPLRHPQIISYLQPDLKGRSFGQFVDSGSQHTDVHWPFGYGKELNEGAFNYLDPVALKHKYKNKQNAVAATQLIPMMVKAAATSNQDEPDPRSLNADARIPRQQLASINEREQQRESSSANLIHPLKCILKLTIRISADPERSGQVVATLLGYGRGDGAQISTLSRFSLRIEGETSFGSPTAPLRYGNLIETGQIDLSLGAMWLHECEANHGSTCSEQNWSNAVQAPQYLRLIDVRSNCIVATPTDQDVRFVALSYVRGNTAFETLNLTKDNIQQLSERNGLAEFWHGVPTTVKDALLLLQAMGERYLWVDALCIIQDVDDEEKQNQISAMDWIYSKAVFTIVAADAQTSMSGLAGVRPGTRNLKQNIVQVRPGTRILSPIESPKDLDTTVWNSRAWTLQEGLLSRRMLVFQGNQMVWHCRSSTAHEDMTPADKGVTYPLLPWLTLQKQSLSSDGNTDGSISTFPDQTTHVVRSETFRQYAELISEYTSRQLTNDDDILDAIGGFLHIFRQFFKFPMRYGLPEILFDVALLWQPAEMLEDRNEAIESEKEEEDETESPRFPSWSWAGWKGRIKYEEPFSATFDQFLGTLTRTPPLTAPREERIRPLIRWHFKNKTNPELSPLNKSGLGIPLFGKKLPEEWEKTPFGASPTPELRLEERILERLEPHHLVFTTTSISTFTLGKPLTQASDTAYNPSNPPLRFNINGSSGSSKSSGTVLLDGEGPTKLVPGRHEFIVIAEAQFYGLDYEQGDSNTPYPLYVVMLVECRGGVARRLGLGRVEKGAWHRERPRTKVVILE